MCIRDSDFFDASGNKIAAHTISMQDTSATTELHQSRVDFTAPSNLDSAYVYVYVVGSDGSSIVPLLLDEIILSPPGFSDLRLETNAYTVAEGAGSVQVRVVRENGADGPASVEYDTIDETAVAGQDYQARSGTLSWADGASGVRTISIPIINDGVPEPNKRFRVTIDNVTGQVTLLAPRTATVTIDDDDSVLAAGDGLLAEYFNNSNFTNRQLVRTDATVNFNWGTGSPATGIGADTFSVRWSGQVEPRYSETYTFRTRTDDGVRLWVNDQLIIDQAVNQSATNHELSLIHI